MISRWNIWTWCWRNWNSLGLKFHRLVQNLTADYNRVLLLLIVVWLILSLIWMVKVVALYPSLEGFKQGSMEPRTGLNPARIRSEVLIQIIVSTRLFMQWTLFIAHRRKIIVGDEVKIIWTVFYWFPYSYFYDIGRLLSDVFFSINENQTQNLIWDIGDISLKQTFSQPTCRVLHFLRTFWK